MRFCDPDGPYDERMIVCEDYDFWLRVTAALPIGLVPEYLVEKYGGHADQLSQSQIAIDRFRVFALLKLLSSGSLSKSQAVQVTQEIQAKTARLVTGSIKRNRPESALYKRIIARVGDGRASELSMLLSSARPTLLENRPT